jgi:hypothetical protein
LQKKNIGCFRETLAEYSPKKKSSGLTKNKFLSVMGFFFQVVKVGSVSVSGLELDKLKAMIVGTEVVFFGFKFSKRQRYIADLFPVFFS